MNPDFNLQVQDALNRRVFLRNTTSFLGLSALAGLTQAKTSSSGLPGFHARSQGETDHLSVPIRGTVADGFV